MAKASAAASAMVENEGGSVTAIFEYDEEDFVRRALQCRNGIMVDLHLWKVICEPVSTTRLPKRQSKRRRGVGWQGDPALQRCRATAGLPRSQIEMSLTAARCKAPPTGLPSSANMKDSADAEYAIVSVPGTKPSAPGTMGDELSRTQRNPGKPSKGERRRRQRAGGMRRGYRG